MTPHSLRHSFATPLLERGTDIGYIQALPGHDKLDTTARYTRVATGTIAAIESPLDSVVQARPGQEEAEEGRAADPKHQGAKIGFIAVPHTWGLFANGNRAANIQRARERLGAPPSLDTNKGEGEVGDTPEQHHHGTRPCPCCGGPMILVEVFEAGCRPKARAPPEAMDSP